MENYENFILKEIPNIEEHEATGLISYLILKSKSYIDETFSFFKRKLSQSHYEFLKFSKSDKNFEIFCNGIQEENDYVEYEDEV